MPLCPVARPVFATWITPAVAFCATSLSDLSVDWVVKLQASAIELVGMWASWLKAVTTGRIAL